MSSARHDLSSATAAILCGGLGTRLAPMVADRPKALAEIAGRPFLHYLLEQVAGSGLRRALPPEAATA
ncbi:MAG: NTP transferase domain-containing protein [Deltaproteobacteria bacterium]